MDADGVIRYDACGRRKFQLLFGAAVAFPNPGIAEAKRHVIELVRRGGTVRLGNVLVRRAERDTFAVEILLFGGSDEVVDGRAAAIEFEAALPTLG
jgi:hypothetical protein